MSANDGGPAFPNAVDCAVSADKKDVQYVNGMSLRDYFAGQALMGLMANRAIASLGKPMGGEPGEWFYATWAYAFADAMLRAREK